MVCSKCNNTISDNSIFCPFCGEKVEKMPEQQEPKKQVVDHVDYIPNVQQNPFVQGNPYAQNNPYYNQQQNFHEQPGMMYYGTPGYNSMQMYAEYNKKATDLRNLGIVAAILMFGIGIIFSIIIWVSKSSAKMPTMPPQNMQEQALLEDAQKKFKTANILSWLPVIALVLCFFIGIISGLAMAL